MSRTKYPSATAAIVTLSEDQGEMIAAGPPAPTFREGFRPPRLLRSCKAPRSAPQNALSPP
jgi:hypothetical protein